MAKIRKYSIDDLNEWINSIQLAENLVGIVIHKEVAEKGIKF